MGLKTRLIKTMLEQHATTCAAALNAKLQTNFAYTFDWTCVPDNADGWGWDDADYKTCLYTSYFKPIEDTFGELFREAAYRDAITTQLKRITVGPGRSTAVDFDVEGDALLLKNTLGANQLNGPAMYLAGARSEIERVINSKLS
jgi:hypothetical protein